MLSTPATSPPNLRRPYSRQSPGTEFLHFLFRLARLASVPIIAPLRLLYQTLTAPLTISLLLKLIFLCFLSLISLVLSVFAVGAFFWTWSTGGPIEAEGWLVYGSRKFRLPHTNLQVPLSSIVEDVRYDIQVEMELLRPRKGSDALDNFMLSLDLMSAKDPQTALMSAAQPTLAPSPLPESFITLPSLSTRFIPPCVLPWPFRSFCPSKIIGYGDPVNQKVLQRRAKAGFSGPASTKDIVPLRKDLMEGVLLKPSRVSESVIGSIFLSIGREDFFMGDFEGESHSREVKTTGWVVVRFIPRPSGIRWLISVHPFPPLLLLPPLSLSLTLLSSIFGYAMITAIRRKPSNSRKSKKTLKASNRSQWIRDPNARSGQEVTERQARVQDRAGRTRRASNYTDADSTTYSESRIPTENTNSASTSEIGDRSSVVISDDESTSSR
ncbi:hypothetical protein J010_00202 [Cryptococcus neoformans]|nr:hypothetical protein C355_00218 [Cryptococcus neoformans var. grubii Th84]OXH19878.1 hypothetical protein J010_00202 [Cryptococcus neoformans var. grubii]OXH39401.1 hypothetical protein J009_00222 [Cryptococcus neoformans var. grubii]OXH60083.1 hypothetical protein J003_00224 [Cryptococcus neoformans var. grubii]OXH60738.1 hypothetical protein J004_00227 [Cryptococcus neoformans var. grubii]